MVRRGACEECSVEHRSRRPLRWTGSSKRRQSMPQIQYSEKYYDDVNEYRWAVTKPPAKAGLTTCVLCQAQRKPKGNLGLLPETFLLRASYVYHHAASSQLRPESACLVLAALQACGAPSRGRQAPTQEQTALRGTRGTPRDAHTLASSRHPSRLIRAIR